MEYLNTYGIPSDKIDEKIIKEEMNNFPFTLNEQQVNAIRECLNKPVSIVTGPAGCVDGDTKIYLLVEGSLRRKAYTVSEAYSDFHGGDLKGKYVQILCYSEKENKFTYTKVDDIVYNGHQELFKVDLLRAGKSIKATRDHRVLTKERGYVPLELLTFSDEIVTRKASTDAVESFVPYQGVSTGEFKPVFDICCSGIHNFVANDIVVHNCGKSSITKALYNIYGRCKVKTILLAPTAKAALRLSECTGGYASTIHRFLGMGIDVPFEEIESISAAKLDNTVIIIDEASMLDILLFNKLLDTAGPTTKFILVGDNNQLPSVQAGNVLGDLIKSFRVPTAILTDVMRQGKDSHIIKYCNMINNGEIFEPCEVPDFHYEEFGEADELREVLVKHYAEDVKKYGLQEVQVITPYKKGELGMNNLNLLLQKTYNVAGMDLTETYKLGDRVRHTVNNYKKGVFNGETGVICDFNAEDNCIIVDYGDRRVSYEATDLYELTLSYCSTVHASQGSEYKICYVILDDTAVNDYLFIRRLLYTAVSRGKEKVYVLSKPYLLDKCITNASYKPRITKLAEFLQTVNVLPYV